MWKSNFLGDVMKIERGGSPRPIKDYLTQGAGVNWIKIGDTKQGDKYIVSTKEKIKESGIKRSRYVKSGDFLLSNSMSFGRPYILKIDGCIHDGWLVLSDYQREFNQDYLYYLLSSEIIKKEFQKSARGSTVQNLNIGIVSKVKVSYPSIPMQVKIVKSIESTFLQIDEAIKLNQTLISNYFDLKSAFLAKKLNSQSE